MAECQKAVNDKRGGRKIKIQTGAQERVNTQAGELSGWLRFNGAAVG